MKKRIKVNFDRLAQIPPDDKLRGKAVAEATSLLWAQNQKELKQKHFAEVNAIKQAMLAQKAFEGVNPNLIISASPLVDTYDDAVKNIDSGWMSVFREIDMTQSPNQAFRVRNITGTGITFYQRLDGEPPKLSKLPDASDTLVSYLQFTGGVTVPDNWLRFNETWRIPEIMSDAERSFNQSKSAFHYALITALGAGINESFDTDDATTWNNACAGIIEDLRTAGYNVGPNPNFVLLYNHQLSNRVMKAFIQSWLAPNDNISTGQITYNLTPVRSTTIASTSIYVILPGLQSRTATWEALNLTQKDEFKASDYIWNAMYNAAIGETAQYKRCALS